VTETNPLIDTALAAFSRPDLSTYRSEVLDDWAKEVRSPDLREAMLANPRLQNRLAARVSETAPLPEIDDLAGSPDFPVIAVILTKGAPVLARAVGLAWHRSTIMAWITWNQLGENLPGVSFEEARASILCVSEKLALENHLPQSPMPKLNEEDLETFGLALLDVWLATLPQDLANRVMLFSELAPAKPHAGRAGLVRAIAQMIISKGT